MGTLLSLLVLALPTILVMAARIGLRSRPGWEHLVLLTVLIMVWSIALLGWSRYSVQDTDVGLMVEGMLAAAVTLSAVFATAVAFVMGLRR